MPKRSAINAYVWLAIGSIVATIAVLVVPYASIYYSFERTYVQTSMVLTPLAAVGLAVLCKPITRRLTYLVTIGLFLAYFAFYSGLSSVALGSSNPYVSLFNSGPSYAEQYVFSSEVSAARWLSARWGPADTLLADNGDASKILAYGPNIERVRSQLIIPSQVTKSDFVFSGRTNTLFGIAYTWTKGGDISYQYPSQFLRQNKNAVYSNGSVVIYK
jgi:uncharacterized membrane protein